MSDMIDKKTLGVLQGIKDKKEDGTLDEDTKNAVEALDMASQLMEAIMAGRQLDLSFYSIFANSAVRKLRKKKKAKGSDSENQ